MSEALLIAIVAGLGASLGWGTSDFFAKKIIHEVGEMSLLFWMKALGAIPFFIFFLFVPQQTVPTQSMVVPFLLFGFFYIVGYLLFYRGFNIGRISILSPILASYGGFNVLVVAFLFGEYIPPFRWIALGFVVGGILISSTNIQDLLKGIHSKKGILRGLPEILGAVSIYSFWYPLWDRFVAGRSPLFFVTLLRIAELTVLSVLVLMGVIKTGIKRKFIFPLVLIAVFDSAAWFLATWGYSSSPLTSVVAVLSAVFSVPTIILAHIFLKEKLSLWESMGIAIILAGIVTLIVA